METGQSKKKREHQNDEGLARYPAEGSYYRILAEAWRSLFESKLYAGVVVLSLAICIGINAIVLNAIDEIYWRPDLYKDSDRIVRVGDAMDSHSFTLLTPLTSWICYEERKRDLESVEAMGINRIDYYSVSFNQDGSSPVTSNLWQYTASAFDVFGVDPLMGRLFTEQEEEQGAEVAILLHDTWVEKFNRDPDILGKKLYVRGAPFEIIGVLKRSFVPPPGEYLGETNSFDTHAIVPFPIPNSFMREPGNRYYLAFSSFAKLRKGVSLRQFEEELRSVASANNQRFPHLLEMLEDSNYKVVARELREDLVLHMKSYLMLLLFCCVFIFAIGCANVVGLTLVRNSRRMQEFAIRHAVGASLGRLVRRIWAEAAVLGVLGCIGGIAIFLLADPLSGLLGFDRIFVVRPSFDLGWLALGLIVGMSALAALLLAILSAMPVLRVSNLGSALREDARTGAGGKRASGYRSALIFVQVAFVTVILILGVLLLKSFLKVLDIEPGYDPTNIATITFKPDESVYSELERRTMMKRIVDEFKKLPGVKSVGINNYPGYLYVTGNAWVHAVARDDQHGQDYDNLPKCFGDRADEGYFETLGIKLVQGRMFDQLDMEEGPKVVIVDTKFVEDNFPDENPIGKRVILPYYVTANSNAFADKGYQDYWSATIIGVVEQVRKENYFERPARGMAYFYIYDMYPFWQAYSLRTDGNPWSALLGAKETIENLYPHTPVGRMSTVSHDIESLYAAREKAVFVVMGVLGIAISISVIGLFVAIKTSVDAQRKEIGIRVALGARASRLLGRILAPWLGISSAAIVTGMLISMSFSKSVDDVLFEMAPRDPVSYTVAFASMLAVVVLASYLSVREALRISPARVLRMD